MKKEVTRALVWSAANSWGGTFITFIISVMLARLLEPRAFGLVAMALVYIRLVGVFVDQGLGSALVQRKEIERAHLDSAFWISLGSGMLLTAASMVLAEPIAALYGEPSLAPVIRWLSLALTLNGLQSTQRALLQRDLAFHQLTVRSLVASISGGAVGIAAAIQGFGVWSLVAQTLTSGAVGTAVLWTVSGWRPGLRASVRHGRDLFGFSAHVLGTNLLSFFNTRADDFIIGLYLGPVALGYYTVAYGLLRTMIGLLTRVTTAVALPTFSRLQDDLPRMRQGFYTATRWTSLISFPAFVGLMLVAPEFVQTVYGPKWSASVPVMRILSLIGILHSVYYFNGSVMLAAGKASWRLAITLLNAITNLIGFLIAVQWGIAAVAAAYVIRGYALSPIPLWALRKLIGIDYRTYFAQYRVPILGTAVMAATVLLLKRAVPDSLASGIQLGIFVLGGVAAYVIALELGSPQFRRDVAGTLGSLMARPSPSDTSP